MNFKDFLKLIKEKYWLIVICVVVVVTGIFWFNSKIETTYEGNVGFSIVRFGRTEKGEFNDYYATQADNLVTANFAKWLQSKAFIASVYERAERNLDGENLDKILKKTTAQKVSGTDISYSFEVTNKDSANQIGQAVINEVAARNAQIQKESNKNQNLRGIEVSSKLTVYQLSTNQFLNYILGIIGGLILGFILILLIRYFKL